MNEEKGFQEYEIEKIPEKMDKIELKRVLY